MYWQWIRINKWADFQIFKNSQGIQHEKTNTYNIEQNEIPERYNNIAFNGIKALLKESGFSEGFWSEALLHFT